MKEPHEERKDYFSYGKRIEFNGICFVITEKTDFHINMEVG